MKTHRIRRACGAIAIAATLASPAAMAIVPIGASSTFDTNDDGWKFVDVPGVGNYADVQTGYPASVVYSATGGNPGGYISATDPSNLTFFFAAPAKFLGDQSLVYGGTLKYDIKVDPATPAWTGDPDVVLVSTAGILVYDVGTQAADNPGTSFSTRTIGWTEVGWRVGSITGTAATKTQFQQVIADVDRLMIAGEFVASTPGVAASFETASLDNVMLTPVPEPSEALLMALGLAGVLSSARLRARSTGR